MISYSGNTLAYIGDAIFELKIREYLLKSGITKMDDLHKTAIKYTSAKMQSVVIKELINSLSEEEIDYYKRGRNATASHKPKSSSLKEYHESSGLEALLGAIFLKNDEKRLNELIDLIIILSNKEISENR